MVESDEEQVEVLKQWWDDNGTSLVVTIVLALGGTFGYQAWQNNVQEQGEAASVLFENLIEASANVPGDVSGAMKTTARSVAGDLKEDYADATYAVFASLHLAKLAVDDGDLDAAQTELKWALENNDDALLETMIRVRLARVHLAADDPTAAMALLVNHKPAQAQISTLEEAKGDVFFKLGDGTKARQAYQLAINNLGDAAQRPVLELKLADIPLDAPVAEAGADETDSVEDDA